LLIRKGVTHDPDNKEKATDQKGPVIEKLFKSFMEFCYSNKVAFVVAAGNRDPLYLHQSLPQRLGTADNNLITVGGVEKDGTFWKGQTTAEEGRTKQPGHVDVFAPAVDIDVPGPGVKYDTGTSQAAAIVVSALQSIVSIPNTHSVRVSGILVWAASIQQPRSQQTRG